LLFLGRFVPVPVCSLLLQFCNEVLYMPMEAIRVTDDSSYMLGEDMPRL